MFESLKTALRRRALKRHSSDVPTGMLPTERLHSAALFLPLEECTPALVDTIRSWFTARGVAVSIFALTSEKKAAAPEGVYLLRPRDLDCLGRIRRGPVFKVEEDFFVSLFEQDPFAVEYAARCSRAAFKAGRSQLDGDVYDLVTLTPDGESACAADAFALLSSLLDKIR